MPYKTFEYLSHGKYAISSIGTAFAEFTEKNEIGWQIEYSTEDFNELLNTISCNQEQLEEKKQRCLERIVDNICEKRAEKVAKDLVR